MKKYLLVLVVMLLVVTGCGEKKLTCTKEEAGSKEKITMTFKKDEIKKFEMVASSPLTEEYTDEYIKEMESFACGMMAMAGDFVDCKVEKKKDTVDVVISMNFDKMTKEEKEEMGYTAEEATYDKMKKSAEEDGYTCK